MTHRRLTEVVVLRFWARKRSTLAERTVELDDGSFSPPALGEMARRIGRDPS